MVLVEVCYGDVQYSFDLSPGSEIQVVTPEECTVVEMDVSFNNVVESTRQYFQGVPTPGGPGQGAGGGYPSAPFWPQPYQQKQHQYPRDGPEHQHQQQPVTSRLPSLAPFSTLNYRGSGGNLQALTSIKSSGQGSYDVTATASRYPSPSGYSNFYSQHHQQQQQQQQQQQIPHHIQQQQAQAGHQPSSSQQQQAQLQHHHQQQMHHAQLQHHQQQQQQAASKEHQSQLQQSHQQGSQQQSSQAVTQKQHQQSLQSHQQTYQNHHPSMQGHHQQASHPSHQSNQQQVITNHKSGPQHHQGQSNHQGHHQGYHDSQQQAAQSHSQMLQLQTHKQAIQNHKIQQQLLQNQQTLQSIQHHGQHQQYQNHQQPMPSHHQQQQQQHGLPKYQLQNHQGLHGGLHQQVMSQIQPSQQQLAHHQQQQMSRQSPHAMSQQHAALTRQSPHLHQNLPSPSHHHQQVITRQSPHISSHQQQQQMTRQSPHLPQSPSLHHHQQQQMTRQSPLAAAQPLASPSPGQGTVMTSPQPASHSNVHQQQNFFSTPTTPVSGSRTTPTGSAAPAMMSQVKRESPLDLSVKTIRQSADSTADPEHVFYTFHNEFLRGKASGSGQSAQHPLSAAKVDVQPFAAHAEGKKRKESYQPLPSVTSFSRLYQQQQQQAQRSGGLKAEARYPHNYLKRPPEPDKPQASAKVPRVDTWKQTIDQQIEKRFNSYLSSIAVNGERKSPFMPTMYSEQKQNGADKRVLSILRNSLETKEARNQTSQQPKPVVPAVRYPETRLPPSTVVRQNLPPFGALSERNRLQVPRAVDSIQRSVCSQDVVDITDDDEPPAQPPSKGELDGLAAFLAARIRTKAELKQQVAPSSKEPAARAPPTSSAASCSSDLSPRTTPVFSSPESKDLVNKSFSSSDGSSVCATGSNKSLLWNPNPHRVSKENSLISSLSRRRDSDSEGGEVALTDLRRGISSSSLPHGPPPPPANVSPEEEEEFNKWIIVCDELVAQLQQGGKSIRKKVRRRLDDTIFIKKEECIVEDDIELKVKKEVISDESRQSVEEDGEDATMQLRERQPKPKMSPQRKPGPRKRKLKKLASSWQDQVWHYKRPKHLKGMGNKPPNWPRAPSSLPDLDRLNDPPPEPVVKAEQDNKAVAKSLGEEKSFLDRLMQRYSDRKKKASKYEQTDPHSSSSELSSTPKVEEASFKTETIAGYRDDLPAVGDLPPDLKPKIKETKMKPRDFNEERPASAPPPGATRLPVKKKGFTRSPSLAKKKKGHYLKKGDVPRLMPEKRFKPFRRKLKPSGFDYIAKKKKPVVKKEGAEPPRERKKKTNPMTELEIQAEIKGWVLNKGLGETLLHRAARIGSVDVVHYCLEKLHHNPAPRDNAGYTPLHVACSRGHFQIASLLLKYGANVSDSALGGVRPLHEAAENGFTKIVKLLLEHGADPQLATYSGVTAMALATDEEARLLMEMHISSHQAGTPMAEDDPACSSQSKEMMDEDGNLIPSDAEGFEVEESSVPLPNLYRLANEPRTDSWVLFHELAPLLRVKTKEALLKQLGQDARSVLRDMKTSEFYEKAHCRAIKSSAGPKTPKVTLVKYTDTVKFLLGVETTVIPR